jgi:hypothetical protein
MSGNQGWTEPWGGITLRLPASLRDRVRLASIRAGMPTCRFVTAAIREKLAADASALDPNWIRGLLPDELGAVPDPIPAGYLEALEAVGLATRNGEDSWRLWPP